MFCFLSSSGRDNVISIHTCLRHKDHIALIMPYFQHDRFAVRTWNTHIHYNIAGSHTHTGLSSNHVPIRGQRLHESFICCSQKHPFSPYHSQRHKTKQLSLQQDHQTVRNICLLHANIHIDISHTHTKQLALLLF